MSATTFLNSLDIAIDDLDLENRECPICFGALESHDCKGIATQLKCNHIFGKDCLLAWFEDHSTCPICRRDVDYLVEDLDNWRHHRFMLSAWRDERVYMSAYVE